MSYNTINACAHDPELQGRVSAACAQEGAAAPEAVMWSMIWNVSSASDIEAAYAFAVSSGNEHPGGDETVITDGMILASVQAHMPDSP